MSLGCFHYKWFQKIEYTQPFCIPIHQHRMFPLSPKNHVIPVLGASFETSGNVFSPLDSGSRNAVIYDVGRLPCLAAYWWTTARTGTMYCPFGLNLIPAHSLIGDSHFGGSGFVTSTRECLQVISAFHSSVQSLYLHPTDHVPMFIVPARRNDA